MRCHGPLPPLAIPATLHDALLARLDRLAAAKVVAQLGATIGRTFAYDVLQAVASLDAATLQGALAQLVEAEVVAQRGLPPQATYTFKHALIQDAAYRVAAPEHTAAVSPADCPGAGRALSRDRRDAARSGSAALHRRRPTCPGPVLLAAGRATRPRALGVSRGRGVL